MSHTTPSYIVAIEPGCTHWFSELGSRVVNTGDKTLYVRVAKRALKLSHRPPAKYGSFRKND